jgi:ABC-type nitrate/sulfonate/bicarbonate transport system substrate-binding protein
MTELMHRKGTRASLLGAGTGLGALAILSLAGACGRPASSAPDGATGGAGEPATVRLGTGAPVVDYWPMFIAQELGIFGRHGLAVELISFENPATAIQALATNAVDVATVSTDLAINAVERGVPLVSVAGVYNKATYSLVAAKDIASIAELRSKTLAVSDLKDATTLLLRKMLKGHGLRDGDYDVVPVGGSGRRAAAISSGQAAGALLGLPVNFTLESEGYPSLGFTSDVLPEYQFDSVHVMRPWARANGPTLVRLLRALLEATRWLYDPAHRDGAIAILAARFKTPAEIAGRTYDVAVTRLQAFPKEGELSAEGFTAVLETMAELELIGQPVPGAAKYVDLSYLTLARKG